MNELFLLFLVLALIYVVECFSFPSVSDFILAESRGGSWRVRQPPQFAGSWARAPVFKFPLPPLPSVCLCRAAPIHISEDGVRASAYHDDISASGERGLAVKFSDIKAFYCEGTSVWADETCLIKVSSEIYARHLANVLEEVRKCRESDREAKIEKQIDAMFDSRLIERRLDEYRRCTAPLRWACNVLFFNLFLVLPLGAQLVGLPDSWPVLLILLVANTSLIAAFFYYAHALLYPRETGARFTAIAATLLSPPFALRANDLILRDLFCSFHPLAVIRSVCSADDFLSVASRAIRESRFPLQTPLSPDASSSTRRRIGWEQRLVRAIDNCAAGSAPIETLLKPPTRQSSGSKSYCPRCLAQYVMTAGNCSDCPHVQLVPFAGEPE